MFSFEKPVKTFFGSMAKEKVHLIGAAVVGMAALSGVGPAHADASDPGLSAPAPVVAAAISPADRVELSKPDEIRPRAVLDGNVVLKKPEEVVAAVVLGQDVKLRPLTDVKAASVGPAAEIRLRKPDDVRAAPVAPAPDAKLRKADDVRAAPIAPAPDVHLLKPDEVRPRPIAPIRQIPLLTPDEVHLRPLGPPEAGETRVKKDGSVLTYDDEGKLASLTHPNGDVQHFNGHENDLAVKMINSM